MKILVSGASGFVGGTLIARLAAAGHEVIAASRSPLTSVPPGVQRVAMNELGGSALPLTSAVSADVVVHAAARVHVMRETAANPLEAFRATNVTGSLALARQTRAAGARRFVYMSSIKVLGEASAPGVSLGADSPPAPTDPYGASKFEAERALSTFCAESGMDLVVIRPPLVYGPGVKGNFRHLMQAVLRRQPLPFGRLERNRRSFVALDNLTDLIAVCTGHSSAAGRCFLVSDGEDLSTAELIRRIAHSLGVAPRMVPVPEWALRFAGAITGRRDAVDRLCGSLQLDISATRRELGWTPAITVDEGLARAAASFRRDENR
jgi:nucleoside-diphosphate-sugar epimerase